MHAFTTVKMKASLLDTAIAAAFTAAQKHPFPGPDAQVQPSSWTANERGKVDCQC
jgi:hypothetical protein